MVREDTLRWLLADLEAQRRVRRAHLDYPWAEGLLNTEQVPPEGPYVLSGPATDVEATKVRHSAAAFRRMLDASLGGRQGVQYTVNVGTDLKVTATGADVNVSVAAGGAFIRGTQAAGPQGMYHAYNDAAKVINVLGPNPAHATLDRIDLVVFRVNDSFYSGATDNCSIEMVTGTPAGSPAVPAAPANSLILAQISVVHATAVINPALITDRRVPAGTQPVKIFDSQLTVAAANFTIPIPPGGKVLRLAGSLRSTNAGTGEDVVAAQANADVTAANYDSWAHYLTASTATWSVSAFQGVTLPPVGMFLTAAHQTSSLGSSFEKFQAEFDNYSDSVSLKGFVGRTAGRTARATASMFTRLTSGYWQSTAPLTQLVLVMNAGTFDVGSHVEAFIDPA